MPEAKTERISIRLTKTLRRRLEKLGAADHRKLATYIEVVLQEHADRTPPPLRLRRDARHNL
jgi:predicted DNA-binding protein